MSETMQEDSFLLNK